MARWELLLAAAAPVASLGAALWPPRVAGNAAKDAPIGPTLGSEWRVLGGDLAAHSDVGGRTLARAQPNQPGRLLVFLPGTFTIPAQFASALRYGFDAGFDVIGLDYAWGPAPDAKRSAACASSGACQACQRNFHEAVLSGHGSSLLSGELPVFGGQQLDAVLKYTKWFTHGIQFLPSMETPPDASTSVSEYASTYIRNITQKPIERMLVDVLVALGWGARGYLHNEAVDWRSMVVAGHSQGASHAAFIAAQRPVHGAVLFSGPYDSCGTDGADWANQVVRWGPERRVFACYTEPDQVPVERNGGIFTQVAVVESSPAKDGDWCLPKPHCSTAVDDDLSDATVKECFPFLGRLAPTLSVLAPTQAHVKFEDFPFSAQLLLIGLCAGCVAFFAFSAIVLLRSVRSA